MGTAVHKKLGNVSVKLAVAFLVGSGAGTFIGGAINKGLYNKDPLLSEAFISAVYAILLGFLGFYALGDFLRSSKGGRRGRGRPWGRPRWDSPHGPQASEFESSSHDPVR